MKRPDIGNLVFPCTPTIVATNAHKRYKYKNTKIQKYTNTQTQKYTNTNTQRRDMKRPDISYLVFPCTAPTGRNKCTQKVQFVQTHFVTSIIKPLQ